MSSNALGQKASRPASAGKNSDDYVSKDVQTPTKSNRAAELDLYIEQYCPQSKGRFLPRPTAARERKRLSPRSAALTRRSGQASRRSECPWRRGSQWSSMGCSSTCCPGHHTKRRVPRCNTQILQRR